MVSGTDESRYSETEIGERVVTHARLPPHALALRWSPAVLMA